MGPNENNSFYSKQHLTNNNAFLLMEEQNSNSTATSPFPQTLTNISTNPTIHNKIYSTNLVVEEEPSSTTEELPEEWNNCVNQSLGGLTDLRVHELKTECKKRQLAVSGSKQQLIDRLQPFEHQIMLQQKKDSFLLFNEEKKKKKNVMVVDNICENGCCSSPSVIDAVIDSVIDGSGFNEERNLNCSKNTKLDSKRGSNINKIKKENQLMMSKNNKQKRNGTAKTVRQKGIFTLGSCNLEKSKMFINDRWKSFLGNLTTEKLSNIGCKCCSCGYNNNTILKNKNLENNEGCLKTAEENKITEEEEVVEEKIEIGELEEDKEEKNEEINENNKIEESLENEKTFSFAQMGSGGQFTPLEPADISIVISEENKSCNNKDKNLIDKEENLKQQKQQQLPRNDLNNSKTFLELPQTIINNNRINLLSTDKQQNIKKNNNVYCCQQCCCSPFPPFLPPSPCLVDVCVSSLDNQKQHQKQQQNEQNQQYQQKHQIGQQKHQIEQNQHLSVSLIREQENNNINNLRNTRCFYCIEEENQQQQQTYFSGNEQILSAATLSKHEELLRQQQQKITELQQELANSQIALQKHQQMLAEARRASQPRDPETGIVFGQVEYWLGKLINTYKEQQLTLQRQMIGQRALIYAEQKLQEELHTEQAVQDICRLIGQESKTALLIVQLLRRYQLERNVISTTNNNLINQSHSENLMNVHEEEESDETLVSLTKTKRKNKKQEKNQNTTNTLNNIKRKGGGRSKSALEGLISTTKEQKNNSGLKRSGCFDSSNNINQKRPNSSLGTTNNSSLFVVNNNTNNSVDMEEIFRSVLEGNYVNNNQPNSNNSHLSTTLIHSNNINEEFSSNENNNYDNLRESKLFIENIEQSSFNNIHNQEMEKTMQDLMEVLQNDQNQINCNNNIQCCINSNQTTTNHLANILAAEEAEELNGNNSSDIFSSFTTTDSTTLFQDSYTPLEQQQTSTSFTTTQINQLEYKQNNNNNDISEDTTIFFSSCEENERALDWLDTFDSFTTVF